MCNHHWVDTGLTKTWCKYCDAEGYWSKGSVVITSLPRMSLLCYGVPITYTSLDSTLGAWLEGTLGSPELLEDIIINDFSHVDHVGGSFQSAVSGMVPKGKPDYINITVTSHDYSKLHIQVGYPTDVYTGTIPMQEAQISAIHRLLVDNCSPQY